MLVFAVFWKRFGRSLRFYSTTGYRDRYEWLYLMLGVEHPDQFHQVVTNLKCLEKQSCEHKAIEEPALIVLLFCWFEVNQNLSQVGNDLFRLQSFARVSTAFLKANLTQVKGCFAGNIPRLEGESERCSNLDK